jgi:hypothetical protein
MKCLRCQQQTPSDADFLPRVRGEAGAVRVSGGTAALRTQNKARDGAASLLEPPSL